MYTSSEQASDADSSAEELSAQVFSLSIENAMLRLAVEEMPQGLSVLDGQDKVVFANRHVAEVWGVSQSLLEPGATFHTFMANASASETEASRQQPAPVKGSVGVRRREWLTQDGRTIEVTVTRLADGSTIALHDDITEQRRSEARIAFHARHDPLTGLPNRLAMRDELHRQLARNARGEELAVLCVDLDRFKVVNDMFGHAVGDTLLTQVADRLRGCARGTDFVVRLGGDEFAVFQCGTQQPVSATALAHRLIAALGEPFDLGGQVAQIGASIGIALAPFDGDSPDALLKSADLALYRAKAAGRGTLRFFEPGMDAQAQQRRALESDLRQALAQGQLHLAYQPQVNMKTLQVTGVEALLRWVHPTRGNIPPVEFIPLAEETGLIIPIGAWVLAQACRDAVQWPAHVRVAVNVSAVQFTRRALLSEVMAALNDAGLNAQRLEIEITESVLLQDQKQALGLLTELRAQGVRVAMDDFGTGYSSLSYLRSFAFDRIKIDRSFVHDVVSNPEARAIVRAIAGLGSNLGMAVTAEGVETLAQLDVMRLEGCTEVQGYLFSQPRPASEITEIIGSIATRQWT
jgi:diguanylate cyclase (GGDEF)-like protein/PAS domain S-box-containing protein